MCFENKKRVTPLLMTLVILEADSRHDKKNQFITFC